MKVIKFICLPLLLLILLSGTALAAPASAPTITVEINNSTISTDIPPYLTQGTTMVPLNVVKHIPGITVAWNNGTKTVTIGRSGETITLVAGHKTALIGSKPTALPVASVLLKGRVMVPIRFIAEAADAHVAWNAATRIVYVAKADEALITQLQSANLGEARTAALHFPRVSTLKQIPIINESQNQDYYFPEGTAARFFIQGGPGFSYYEVTGNYAEEIWSAKIDYSAPSSAGLFFVPYKIVDQAGKMPAYKGSLAFYHLMLPVMEATYGFIDATGASRTVGQQNMKLNEFFEIPGEASSSVQN
ncbi:copper amine oxidase N-terminal domain-containing protein [Paenibacillus sp. FSL R10-2771]|uniref:copper amine oxidase N-terminal domain-containing protein n=1 Tax=Paenibacillus sp. FSL R10-2771 TaxID=2954693 RepID=UPI0030FBD1A6